MTTNLSEIGRTIAQRRKMKGLKSQERLSKASGVHRQRISDMERGCFHGRITDLIKVLDSLGLELTVQVRHRPVFEDLKELFPDDED